MGNKIKNKIAVFGYVLLEKLPSEGGLKTEVSGLSDYLSWLYKFALAAAAFLAVLMIVVGGIQMIVGGASETARSDGKKRIEQAIWGLLLAITAWLILYSINPDLVKTGLTIPDITIDAPVVTTTTTATRTRCDVYGGILTGGHQTFFYGSLDECMQKCSSKNCVIESSSLLNSTSVGASDLYKNVLGPPIVKSTSLSLVPLETLKDTLTKENTKIIIDKSDKKLYVEKDGKRVASTDINIGSADKDGTAKGGKAGDNITPVGEFTITGDKRKNENGVLNNNGKSLGTVFLGISAKDENGNYRGIGIHGSQGNTLGSTSGCIKVTNADANLFFDSIKEGTKVVIQI